MQVRYWDYNMSRHCVGNKKFVSIRESKMKLTDDQRHLEMQPILHVLPLCE